MKLGFFKVDDLHKICSCNTLTKAKIIAKRCIDKYVENHPKTQSVNIKKAINMINNCYSVDRLAISISNFMLAHPSENLSMSRGEK